MLSYGLVTSTVRLSIFNNISCYECIIIVVYGNLSYKIVLALVILIKIPKAVCEGQLMPTVWLLRLPFAFNSETLFFTFIILCFFCDFQIILKICALYENTQLKMLHIMYSA